MTKLFTVITLCVSTLFVNAQAPSTIPATQPFGKIDKADLEMTACDFEKDANAEVLFDKGTVYFTNQYELANKYELVFERHIRTKIFNENGNSEANVHIEFYEGSNLGDITNLEAETINLNNGKIELIMVDKKSIYKQQVDKLRSVISFSFPRVRPGSVIEFKYKLTTRFISNFPNWFFQADIPTRYSEFTSTIPPVLFYKQLVMTNHPFIKRTDNFMSMANVPSFHDEPFMTSRRDNLERVLFDLSYVNAPGLSFDFSDSWAKVSENEANDENFGGQFKRKLEGEEVILDKAKTFKTDAEKIAYIFNEVKNNMKWNGHDVIYTNKGTKEAWLDKTGNCTEINLILYHLLQKAGLNVYPMLVSTRDHGKVNPAFPCRYQFNKTVNYIPVDSDKYYILDATSRYNAYNQMPGSLLNNFGLCIDKEDGRFDLVFLKRTSPVRQVALINGEIKPDGKLNGTAQLTSFDYYRADAIDKYETEGEKKYINYLANGDNNLKISAIKFNNLQVDTLPLTQVIDFKLDLAGSDGTYIYFNPNLFVLKPDNPFLSAQRVTDIDFGYRGNISSSGIYKEPAGYKLNAQPANITITTADKSISFRRLVEEEDGLLTVRYLLDYKKSSYPKDDYPDLHEFFRKMHELLNEQIVFKRQ